MPGPGRWHIIILLCGIVASTLVTGVCSAGLAFDFHREQ